MAAGHAGTRNAIEAIKGGAVPSRRAGIREVGDIPRKKFYVAVRDIDVSGSPPTHLDVWVLVRFLAAGAPCCCGEPACHSHVFTDCGSDELGDCLRRKMNLRHAVTVDLHCCVEYFRGIEFTAFHQ